MIFSPKQINELLEVIRNLHWIFINEELGSKYVPKDIIQKLKKYGIKEKKISSLPSYAFQFGLLSIILEDKRTKNFTFSELKDFISSGKWLPLTKWEQDSLELIENRLVDGIVGLGNKVSSTFKTILIESDLKKRQKFEQIIREKSKKVFSDRSGVSDLISQLGHSTEDWARDFGRISQFVLHEAFDNGRAYALIRQFDGKVDDIKVYKQVHDKACKICEKLYKTYDRKDKVYKPRIFKLSELLKNGTNIGRDRKDWKPVVGSTHPWCRCDLMYVPKNSSYDIKTETFQVERSDLAKKYDLKKFIKVEIEK